MRWPRPAPTSFGSLATTSTPARGLAAIVPRSPVPIVADIHYQYRLALAALEAGVQGLRLNPGNIRKPDQDPGGGQRGQGPPDSDPGGVNAGSLDRELMKEYGAATPEALVASALKEIGYLAEEGFDDIKISVKHSHVPSMVGFLPAAVGDGRFSAPSRSNRGRSPSGGLIKSVAGIADSAAGRDRGHHPLLAHRRPGGGGQGRPAIARVPGPCGERTGLDLIACPSCGRAEVDVLALAAEAQAKLEEAELPIQGGGDGLRGERSGRGAGCRYRDRRRAGQGSPVHRRPGGAGGAGGRDGGGPAGRGLASWWRRARRPGWRPPTPGPRRPPPGTVGSCWRSRATANDIRSRQAKVAEIAARPLNDRPFPRPSISPVGAGSRCGGGILYPDRSPGHAGLET